MRGLEKKSKLDEWINTVQCMDCLEGMKMLPDGCVDLVVTDPPYNVRIDYGEYKDRLNPGQYRDFIQKVILEWRRIANSQISVVLGSKVLKLWWDYLPEAKLIVVRAGAISNNRIKNLSLQYHPILTTVKSNRCIPDLWEDIRWPGEGYFFNEPRYGHPAMTPLKLARRLVSLFSKEGDLVFDSFMGSGTVAVACQNGGRRFIGFDTNPDYVDICNQRLAQGILL